LGVTGAGWLLAALYCGLVLWQAVRRREALLVLQAGQAALFQLGAGIVLALLLLIVFGGFLLLGGAVDFLPEIPVLDPFSAGGIVALVVWLISLAAVPAWLVWSLRQAVRAWRTSAAGEIYAYPFFGPLVWEEAPRRLKWMVIQPQEEEEERLESAE
jgi:hypothetical protein